MSGRNEDERQHYCRNCGRFLCASNVALGTPGTIRIQCGEEHCGRMNLIRIGELPLPRPDRDQWVMEMRRRRRRATVYEGVPS